MNKRTKIGLFYTSFFLILTIITSFYVIQWAKGRYRTTPTQSGIVKETGLLSANSFPKGAQVFVNDKLVTATDNVVYLEPNEYQITIEKEGYHNWKKTIQIEKGLVKQTNALLFPIAPSLSTITFTGINNLYISPNGEKFIYHIASASGKNKNGLYVLDISNNWQNKRVPIQITDDLEGLNKAEIIFSPDSSKIMIQVDKKYFLIEINTKSELSSTPDVFFQRDTILKEWEEELALKEKQILSKFPQEIINIATSSAINIFLSPDETKMLYTATKEAEIKNHLIPPVISANDQSESRLVKPGSIYVYDKTEDKNFLLQENVLEDKKNLKIKSFINRNMISQTTNENQNLATQSAVLNSLQEKDFEKTAINFNNYYSALYLPTFQWMPDSKHLLSVKNNEITISSYDGTNPVIIYSGPFENDFVYPWPDGNKLVILTKFNPQSFLNLYAIELRN